MWTADDITIRFIDDLAEEPVYAVVISTPVGPITVMADVQLAGRQLVLRGLHLHSDDRRPNNFGFIGFRQLMSAALEKLDVDEIVVEGAVRTTGAVPGHRPRPLRFARRGRS